jgi:hypothetical protein
MMQAGAYDRCGKRILRQANALIANNQYLL